MRLGEGKDAVELLAQLEEMETKSISLDNGQTYVTASETMPEINMRNLWDSVMELMDDETREAVAQERHDDQETGISLTVFCKTFL